MDSPNAWVDGGRVSRHSAARLERRGRPMTELQNLPNTIETQQELCSTPEELALTLTGFLADASR
jgi:hypothetical protein